MDIYSFYTIKAPVEAKLTEKNSRFLAYAYPVKSEEEISHYLQQLKELHPKATHHCYAWRLGNTKHYYRANDDGEPSGSAGRPILGQIDSAGITNTFVVIVRYYGGVKLGVSGLIKAYKQATHQALSKANIILKHELTTVQLEVSYDRVNAFQTFINHQPVTIQKEEYSNSSGTYTLEFEKNLEEELLSQLCQFGELKD